MHLIKGADKDHHIALPSEAFKLALKKPALYSPNVETGQGKY
jgi:hypothetical protein